MSPREPLFALSMDDCDAKTEQLEGYPEKEARQRHEHLKQQALVATVLMAFARWPDLAILQFEDDGTADRNLAGYHLIDQAGGDLVPGDETAKDLAAVLWWFFEDPGFRARLGRQRFTREETVDQLEALLRDAHPEWDLAWPSFLWRVQRCFSTRREGDPTQDLDPAIAAVFRRTRVDDGFGKALDRAPPGLAQARVVEPGALAAKEAWSPFARLLVFLLTHPDPQGQHEAWDVLAQAFDTGRHETLRASRFETLAGPRNDPALWAPRWLDPFAALWILFGRPGASAEGSQALAWAGVSVDQADRQSLILCQMVGQFPQLGNLFNWHAKDRCRGFLDRFWQAWQWSKSVQPALETLEAAAAALLYLGGRTDSMPLWKEVKPDGSAFMALEKALAILPPSTALRWALAALATETRSDQAEAAEAAMERWLDAGAALDPDDPHLESRLAGTGVTPALRRRLIDVCGAPKI